MRWLLAPDSPLVIANLDLAPAVLGALMGGLLAMLVLSPSGRHSGGHLNPADTVALWRLKVFPGQAVIPYITAPAAGSLAGTALGGLAWGTTARHAPASARPAPTWNATAVSTAEAGSVVAVTTVLGAFLNRPYTRRRLPYAVGLATAPIIALLGSRSGGSANPARQLGPALLSGNTTHLWIYLLAPVIAALAGADIWRTAAALTRRGRTRHALRSAPDTHPNCPAPAPGCDAWCCGERAM
ncbi:MULTISPECIES: MIP/aquaporin family protein [unclassified Streptomyces]|uniref:MIP/aquaporin family protein n=1 Tax=unclassified Streptomyces TaxID=2593676 RepID=UPI0022564F85|nr:MULTISPECIES: aquaporin [unclassified Streptomyces]WTB52053.1 aquaporin [Streptomyces sp. NBC_00826]WTH95057.1 aquaporin [Streptomyces sp. NBC_00825]WTI03791.1 aquaporin [Streptomyces sp. NBC_00822]MCX4869371.1 aquaporin [Streptomyces sp. NBC_00906]MCX4900610.1 aquaporin [Streptomyces sp. NBC_00892]